jgi:hypothetical protein
MNPPAGGPAGVGQQGGGQGGPQGPQGPQDPQGPQGVGGQGGGGDGQGGGGQPPLPYNNAVGFIAASNAASSDQARDNLEQEAVNRSPAQNVQIAAMLKINLRLQVTVGHLANRVAQAQGQVAAAKIIAR